MDVIDLLKNIDRKMVYLECVNFYKNMSEVESSNYFAQVIESKSLEEKTRIENGIIFTRNQEEKKPYEVVFLEKYHQYLKEKLQKDIREYCINLYCLYLYSEDWSRYEKDDTYHTFCINGELLDGIEEKIVGKHNEIMENISLKKEISDLDRKFLEENFLRMVYETIIYKEFKGEKDWIYEIAAYFDKYPVTDLESPRNRQLSILACLSKRMLEIPGNSAIHFFANYEEKDTTKVTLGFYSKLKDGTPYIQINGLDICELTDIKICLERIFTVLHEYGHLLQDVEFENYEENYQEILTMEKYLIAHDKEFYHLYHDNFLIERDADNYAIVELIKEYGSMYPQIVEEIVASKEKRKLLDESIFLGMEKERYLSLCEENKVEISAFETNRRMK